MVPLLKVPTLPYVPNLAYCNYGWMWHTLTKYYSHRCYSRVVTLDMDYNYPLSIVATDYMDEDS